MMDFDTVTVKDTRTVVLNIVDAEPMLSHGGKLFRPTVLVVAWENGALTKCSLRGPQLRASGGVYVNQSTKGVSYMRPDVGPGITDPETPVWVLEVVRHYQP